MEDGLNIEINFRIVGKENGSGHIRTIILTKFICEHFSLDDVELAIRQAVSKMGVLE